MKGFEAKDKNVRFRVLQIVSEMISTLGEIEYVLVFVSELNMFLNKF